MIDIITSENTTLCTAVPFDDFKKAVDDITNGLMCAYINDDDNVLCYDHTDKAEESGTFINTSIHTVLSNAYHIDVQSTHYCDGYVWICYKNDSPLKIKDSDTAEFVAQIIESFESFLDNKNIVIENDEKTDALKDADDPSEIANIYGSDYGDIQTDLENILNRWNLIEMKG